MSSNAWLQRQRKSDLVEIAELVGLQRYVPLSLASSAMRGCALLHVATRMGAAMRLEATRRIDGLVADATPRGATLTMLHKRTMLTCLFRDSYEGQRKVELEATLDDYLIENADKLVNEPKVAPYYNSRAKAAGSPTKRDAPKFEVKDGLKSVKRRATRNALEALGVE